LLIGRNGQLDIRIILKMAGGQGDKVPVDAVLHLQDLFERGSGPGTATPFKHSGGITVFQSKIIFG
jgi:hypothetical protein